MSSQPYSTLRFSSPRLTRSLSTLETWGFGLTGYISWISIVPVIHAALGPQAILVWVPATIVGILLNYQVKQLGTYQPDVAGGTPNYLTRLLKRYSGLARYAAMGYFFAWAAFLPLNAIVFADLIRVNLERLGIAFPELPLKIAFTLLIFALAFSGTRALSILHLFFIIPAFGLLVVFCIQGLYWLALSPDSPGLLPAQWSSLSFQDWAKWFFFTTYLTYSCETASSFVADSRQPKETLRILTIAAWLMPVIFWGGSWVVIRLATGDLQDSAFLILLAASKPFWGETAAVVVTFWLAAGCLLNCATVVSNCPRILYQLALDRHLAPVFSVVSRRGTFGPALFLMLIFSLLSLLWGNVAEIVVVSNVSWFVSFMALHLGLWLRRGKQEVAFPQAALVILGLETVVLVVGGSAWGRSELLLGLLIPAGMLAVDAMVRQTPIVFFHSNWWIQCYRSHKLDQPQDSIMVQVTTLIFLLCGAVLVGWYVEAGLGHRAPEPVQNLLIVLLMVVVFVGVAIACWTSLPQVMAIVEARESAEHLFKVAQDAIVVVDEAGIIRRVNPATKVLFEVDASQLLGYSLNSYLTELEGYPEGWERRSEQTLKLTQWVKTLDVSISDRTRQDLQEYVIILRDITERKRAEEVLRHSEAQLREQAQQLEDALSRIQQTPKLVQSEKMASLGRLVAGVAHEINNPVNFIYGNLTHANTYIQDLLNLLKLYEQHTPHPIAEIDEEIEEIDLDFLVQDLPKLLASMRVGAERIQQIVAALRTFSRMDEADIKNVNIHEGIDSTLMILQNRLKAKPDHPAIQVTKDYGSFPPVECYAGQLNQVFMNILSNAIDALEEWDQQRSPEVVQQTPSSIHIQTQLLDTKYVRITIADNGPGIPDEIQKRLFEPFFTTKPVGKGTGLGLSISYEIVTEKHGGNLQCISSPGKGTTFVIDIALQLPKQVAGILPDRETIMANT